MKHVQPKRFSLIITDPSLKYTPSDNGAKSDKLLNVSSDENFDPHRIKPSSFSRQGLLQLKQSTGFTWKSLQNPDSVLLLDRILGPGNNRMAYLAETVRVSRDTSLYLSLGSDDGFTLWVNGDSISSHDIGRSVHPDDELIPITLRKGTNVLLYKVTQRDGSWALFRAFRTKKQISAILEKKLPFMFGDLPESCLLSGNRSWLRLNPDRRRQIDSLHFISWKWKGWNGTVLDSTSDIPAYALPDSIYIPSSKTTFLLWDVSVANSHHTVLFREQIPVAYRKETLQRAREIIRDSLLLHNKNVDLQASYQAVRTVFKPALAHDTTSATFATRDQLYVLYRAWQTLEEKIKTPYDTENHLHGIYEQEKQAVSTYRVFSPLSGSKTSSNPATPTVLALQVDFEGTNDYWKTYQAQSHATFWHWAAFSSSYRINIVSPYFSGTGSGFGQSAKDVHHILNTLDKPAAPLTTLAWSKGALTLLELLKKPWLKVENVALISPYLPDNTNDMLHEIMAIKAVHPEIQWFIWHGLDDTDVPVHLNRLFVRLLRKQGFRVTYTEVPYSTHWNYFTDPEQELYQRISMRNYPMVSNNQARKNTNLNSKL